MARVVVIGGSGHVGTYLVPRLVEAGHEVINVSRGQRAPYAENAAWQSVRTVAIDRDAGEQAGSFGTSIAALKADIVVDMICFTLSSAQQLVAALRGEVQHFLHCGTIWVYGHNTAVPATEDQPLNPFGGYGTQKAEIETWLLEEARHGGFPATVVPPRPYRRARLDAAQSRRQFQPGRVFADRPRRGLGPAEFRPRNRAPCACRRRGANRHAGDRQLGERGGRGVQRRFPQAVNLRGYAEAMYRRFGHAPNLVYEPFETWKTRHRTRTGRPPGSTCPAAPATRSKKRGACLATCRAIRRCRR